MANLNTYYEGTTPLGGYVVCSDKLYVRLVCPRHEHTSRHIWTADTLRFLAERRAVTVASDGGIPAFIRRITLVIQLASTYG